MRRGVKESAQLNYLLSIAKVYDHKIEKATERWQIAADKARERFHNELQRFKEDSKE